MAVFKKQQSDTVDLYNVLLCLSVVFIHVSSEPISRYRQDSLIYLLLFVVLKLFSAAVPAFLFLAGYKFAHSAGALRFDYKKYIGRRVRRVLLPYLVAASVFYFYFISRGFETFGWARWGQGLLLGTVASPFYFVILIFQFYLLAPLWLLVLRKVKGAPAILIALAVTVFAKFFLPERIVRVAPGSALTALITYNDRIFISYLVYWAFGCYFGQRADAVKALTARRKALIFSVGLPLAAVHVWLSYLHRTQGFYYLVAEIVHVFFCVAMILMGYVLIRWLHEKIGALTFNKAVLWLDGLSYPVYLWHCLFIYIADDLLYRRGVTSTSLRFALRFVFVYAAAVVFCAAFAWLKSRVKLLCERK
ncbi:MAG: acyltransferase [Clostridiales bacterium]|nr:acyltransferase [Clostridiales bacterium]